MARTPKPELGNAWDARWARIHQVFLVPAHYASQARFRRFGMALQALYAKNARMGPFRIRVGRVRTWRVHGVLLESMPMQGPRYAPFAKTRPTQAHMQDHVLDAQSFQMRYPDHPSLGVYAARASDTTDLSLYFHVTPALLALGPSETRRCVVCAPLERQALPPEL